MSGIFNEKLMMQSLGEKLPDGEKLAAGVHGIGLEMEIRQLFGKCRLVDYKLFPDENGSVIEVSKCKYAKHDIYIGITQNYLVLTECEACKHLYEFKDIPDLPGVAVKEVRTCIPTEDIGTCFSLEEIEKCLFKKAWMGAVNCWVTMKNGSSLKFMLPKLGGVGGGMPHHAEYREAIIAWLGAIGA
ncbi:hypothetical protein D3Z51_07505 [Clostridiaceae bacterium]|nr:hypothetical protein [Clostridiaceae bacterium]RKI14975.1 hypothetical protein D7V81_06995 [bacterium 1XD21-70]